MAGEQPRSPRYTFARYDEAKPWRIEKPAAALIAACLFFALAAGYTVYASEAGKQHILAQIDASKAKAEQATALRTQTQAMTAAITRLADKTHAPKPALDSGGNYPSDAGRDVGAEIQPERRGACRLIGVSAAASQLIEPLAASPLLHNPRFQAPITVASGTQDKGKLESFDIAVTVQAQKPSGAKQ